MDSTANGMIDPTDLPAIQTDFWTIQKAEIDWKSAIRTGKSNVVIQKCRLNWVRLVVAFEDKWAVRIIILLLAIYGEESHYFQDEEGMPIMTEPRREVASDEYATIVIDP